MSSDLDIEALMNTEVDESAVSAVVSSLQHELNSIKETAGVLPPSSQTGQNITENVETVKPIKTNGESSSDTVKPLTLNLSTSNKPEGSNSRRASLSSMSPFGGMTPQSPSALQLTQEEQSTLYKQASLHAIHSLFTKHGADKAKEMLAIVTKVKNFLTNLVQLAGNSGPHVKQTVHTLVQKLVAGSITEEKFAEQIEQDLHSKHQPGLLPFLKTSVNDLRIHLQLQKEFMKQLVEKKVQERSLLTTTDQPNVTSADATTTPLPSSTPVLAKTTPSTTSAPPISDSPSLTPPSSSAAPGIHLASLGVTLAQQQALRLQLHKLPEGQRKNYLEKFIYSKQLQLAALQQKKNNMNKAAGNNNNNKSITPSQQLSVILRQQQLIKEQQQLATQSLAANNKQINKTVSPKKTSSAAASAGLSVLMSKIKPNKEDGVGGDSPTGKAKVHDDDEEDDSMDIAGVNLKEETAHFLPANIIETTTHSCPDEPFLSLSLLKTKAHTIGYGHGIGEISDEFLTYLSHATEERLKNLIEKVTVISRHRADSLKDDGRYEMSNDVRGQLKILERIDEISAGRKQEREKEKIFRAAKSRSKQDDPELAKMKEQAKQIQIAEQREIHQRAANELALAAIGRRKRTATTAFGGQESSSTKFANTSNDSPSPSSGGPSNVFNSPAGTTSRVVRQRIQSKDVIYTLEHEREYKHSLLLYKSHLN
jgi:transcription initiation factor TFIID subunit 4